MRDLCLGTSDGMDDGLLQFLVEYLFICGCDDLGCDKYAMMCVCGIRRFRSSQSSAQH